MLVRIVFGFDRQLNVAGFAIYVDHHSSDFVAFFEHVARVFHAVAADFGGAQVTQNVFAQVNFGAFGIHGFDLTRNHCTLVVDGRKGGEGVGVELLDTQGNTLALHVHRQNDGLHVLALLEVAHGGFARLVPRQVRQVHQAVDACGQAHKHTKVGDGLDRTFHAITALAVHGKFLPRVGTALFHAQADAALVFVDFQHHDFDLVAQGHQFAWGHVFVGPVHFRHVHQTFNAWLEFYKRTVVGNVRDLAEHAGAGGVAAADTKPRVVAHLLETQRHAVLFGVKFKNFGRDFLTRLHHFAGVTHTAPGHVGDVQQAVNAAQVHKRTVFGDVFHYTVNDGTFFEGFHHLGAFLTHGSLNHRTAAQHHVVALAVELDDLELHGFVFIGRQVFGGARVHQGAGQESTNAVDQHSQAAFDLAAGGAGDKFAGFQRFFQAHPRSQTLGFVARQNGVAVTVFDGVNGHGHKVTHSDFNFALIVFKFLYGDIGLRFETRIDHHKIVFNAHHFSGDHFTRAHFGAF